MTIVELKKYLQQGREIEFSFKDKSYFMSYISDKESQDSETQYYIYDTMGEKYIFKGTMKELFKHPFSQCVCFENAIEQFDFRYIL